MPSFVCMVRTLYVAAGSAGPLYHGSLLPRIITATCAWSNNEPTFERHRQMESKKTVAEIQDERAATLRCLCFAIAHACSTMFYIHLVSLYCAAPHQYWCIYYNLMGNINIALLYLSLANTLHEYGGSIKYWVRLVDFLHNTKTFTLFHPSTVIKQVTVSSGTEVGFCPTRTIEFCAIFISSLCNYHCWCPGNSNKWCIIVLVIMVFDGYGSVADRCNTLPLTNDQLGNMKPCWMHQHINFSLYQTMMVCVCHQSPIS